MHKQELRTQLLSRVATQALSVSLAVLATLGVLMADTVLKQRDFEGQIRLSICGPDAKGKSEVKDTLTASIRFPFSVADLASGKTIRSDFVWSGRTAKGASFRVRLVGQGQSTFDPASGAIEQRLPLELEVNGKKESFQLALTTEQVRTEIGTLNGSRVRISGNVGDLTLVGQSFVRQASTTTQTGKIDRFAPDESSSAAKKDNILAVVAEIKGRVIAR